MPKDKIALRTHSFLFHKTNMRVFLYLTLFFIVLNLGLIGYMSYSALTIPQMPYFATTSDGRLIEIYPAE